MKELKLSNSDKIVLIDDEDFERLSKFKWHIAGSTQGVIQRTGYIRPRRTFKMSLAQEVMHNTEVTFDHKDRNPLNNQKSNLREADNIQNGYNRGKTSMYCTSKYKGVQLRTDNKKWRVLVTFNGKQQSVGQRDTEIEAAKLYNEYAIKYHGEFACLNIIE